MLFLHNFPGPSSEYLFANERNNFLGDLKIARWAGCSWDIYIHGVRYHFFAEFRIIT